MRRRREAPPGPAAPTAPASAPPARAPAPAPALRVLPPLALLLVVLLLTPPASAVAAPSEHEDVQCSLPLGMEADRIPDSAISASSSYEAKSVGPQNARINQERNGGAWCPKAQISSEVREFLEVDLERAHRVTHTQTQGRFGNGQGQEYAEYFLVDYWRDALQRWTLYHDFHGRQVLDGNVNTYLVAQQQLDLPFVASRVRFIPFSEHPRTVCMRVELLGCPWDQGVLSYAAPRADEWNPDGGSGGGGGGGGGGDVAHALLDLSYDGAADATGIHGGLGQLTDGRFGAADFLLASAPRPPDPRWVGWRHASVGAPLELVFTFDGPRQFAAARLCVCHAPASGVQVFPEARALFSLDGRSFAAATPRWTAALALALDPAPAPAPAAAAPLALNVTLPLHGRVGRFVKLLLPFGAPWLLISEVSFDSAPLPRNLSAEALDAMVLRQQAATAAAAATGAAGAAEAAAGAGADDEAAGGGGGGVGAGRTGGSPGAAAKPGRNGAAPAAPGESIHARKEITPATNASSNHQAYIGLITGVLAMVVLLLAATVVLMVRRGRKKVALLHKHTALVSSSAKPGVAINMKDLKMNMALSTPVISASLARTRTLPKGCKVAATVAPVVSGVGVGGAAGAPSPDAGADVGDAPSGSVYGHTAAGEESDDSETSSVYHEPYKLLPSAKQEYGCLLKKDTLSSSKSGEYTDFTSVNSFQDEVKFSSSFYKLSAASHHAARPPPYDKHTFTPTKSTLSVQPSENYYAATDILKTERREQHLVAGIFTPLKLPEGPAPDACALLDFSRHRLRLLEKLGEGSFGLVQLCEVEGGTPEYTGSASCQRKQMVVVKSLRRGCSEATRQEFMREAGWLASLRDPNLARVLAICATEEPLCVIQEITELGDLPRFLQLQNATAAVDGTPGLSYGCLIYLATQVASGMKYLESLELVHRDLAARNCAVGKNYSVKITDHAMYCSKYESDYYISDTRSRLPVRWMAWESLLLGKYHPKSDVWAFAVTLWEILMLCAQQPFAELTNEQVVENCNHFYQKDGLQRLLARPASCPREIYDLMGECWKRDEGDRPRFAEIHLFLQRKNLGYVPASG